MDTSATLLIERLNGDELRERLDAIDRERKAIVVLLRAVQARERRRLPIPANKGARHE